MVFDLNKFCSDVVVEIFETIKTTDNKYVINKMQRRFNSVVHKAKKQLCPKKVKAKRGRKKDKEKLKGVKVFKEYENILKPKDPSAIPPAMLDLLKKRHEHKLSQAKNKKQIEDIKRQRVLLELIGFGYSRSEAQKVMKGIFGKGFSATTFKKLRSEYKMFAIQLKEFEQRAEYVRKAPKKGYDYGKDLFKIEEYIYYLTRITGVEYTYREAICKAFEILIKRECAIERGGTPPDWIVGET